MKINSPKSKTPNHQRVVVLGDRHVGKTSLFLRYAYFEQTKVNLMKQNNNRNAYIYNKDIQKNKQNVKIEMCDFLNTEEMKSSTKKK